MASTVLQHLDHGNLAGDENTLPSQHCQQATLAYNSLKSTISHMLYERLNSAHERQFRAGTKYIKTRIEICNMKKKKKYVIWELGV